MLEIPLVVRNKALAVGAAQWLDELPALVAELEQEWGFVTGPPFGDATEAFVAEVTVADGERAVLKLLVPRRSDAVENEITVLQLTAGQGCVRLLRADAARGALLLERLGRSLHELRPPLDRKHDVLCATAARVWRRAPDCGLPTGADNGRRLAEIIPRMWAELDRPCSERAVAYALACAARRVEAHDDERAVLLHGDVHEWNTLEADGDFKLVDPDGLLAEAEYDLGVIMREEPHELLGADQQRLARALARRTGTDAAAVWEWGVVETVSTGLLCTQVDLQPGGRLMLEAADHVAALFG